MCFGAALESVAWSLCSPSEPSAKSVPDQALDSGYIERLVECIACQCSAEPRTGLWIAGHADSPGHWSCADCLLFQEAHSNPFEALDASADHWFRVAALFQDRQLRSGAPVNEESDEVCEDYLAFRREILIFWDGSDRVSYGIANALKHAFPSLCILVNMRDEAAFERSLLLCPGIHMNTLHRPGGVSAVLPVGVYILDCETYPQTLLYELKYRHVVRSPPAHTFECYSREFMEPLHQIRERAVFQQEVSLSNSSCWWQCDDALGLIARSMARHRFCVVDGFLPQGVYQALSATLHCFHRDGALTPGTQYYKLEHRHGPSVGPDLLSDQAEPRKWNMRTESLIYCQDADPRAPALSELGAAAEAVIAALREGGPDGDAECARRLRHTRFREPHLCACYPGEQRGRHARHVDNDSEWLHRTITAIIYLNDGWTKDNGGEFRLYGPEPTGTSVAYDVLPVANRMLFFWATDDCPHEVLHCNADRHFCRV
mmetsp:Transcript_116049/g.369235  ORF Transcript_116049/g.369235 Transcript_116049/m.369235 type:complete len:487 (+) Transcript_116049:146-1606(+)